MKAEREEQGCQEGRGRKRREDMSMCVHTVLKYMGSVREAEGCLHAFCSS